MLKSGVIAICICLFAVALGCQGSGSATTSVGSAAPTQRAILVSGGNTGAAPYIFIPVDGPDKVEALCANANQHVCPECRAAAIKYFATGELDAKCSLTGATRTPLAPPPTVTNQHSYN